MTDTKEFLKQALLHSNTITNVSEILDLIPIIDKYYSYLVTKETYNIPKHFGLTMFRSDIDAFKTHGDIFIDEYINEHKNDNPHLTKDSVYSLILKSSILLEEINVVENILSTFHEENILTYTDNDNYSPISTILSVGNTDILDMIASYIEKYKDYMVKIKSIREEDCEELIDWLKYTPFKFFNPLAFHDEFLVHLYTKEALIEIKTFIKEYYVMY